MNKQPIVYGFALKISIKNTKITFAVLLLFILQGIVGNVYAQEKKISISVKNEKLETVLRMVEKQTNYLFSMIRTKSTSNNESQLIKRTVL